MRELSGGIACVLPVKSLRRAKSRLAGLLDDEQRRSFVLETALRTLTVLASVPALRATLVVSPDECVLAEAARMGAAPLPEADYPDLNASLERARTEARRYGAAGLLVLPADLPLLTAQDVERLLAPGNPGKNLVLAPDRAGVGTNALYVTPVFPLPFCFGPGSFARHLLAACKMNADVAVLRTPGLELDVDTPEDYRLALLAHGEADGPGGFPLGHNRL